MTGLPDFPSLGIFGTGLSQNARLVTLTSAQESGLPESLVVERFTGREAVNELFCFELDALSTSTDLELSLFVGDELTVALLQPDGSRRAWHGICTEASWLGADGGIARYRLRLEPALALLSLRRDCYIFQDMNAREIVTELLADYSQVRFGMSLNRWRRAPFAPSTAKATSNFCAGCSQARDSTGASSTTRPTTHPFAARGMHRDERFHQKTA